MDNISFFLTTAHVRARIKDVTRRLGWKNLKPGTLLQAVVKSQGLGKGGKIEPICIIRVKDVRQEQLRDMLDNEQYGCMETVREGFPDMTPGAFVKFFCESHKRCTPRTVVTRIEFEYV